MKKKMKRYLVTVRHTKTWTNEIEMLAYTADEANRLVRELVDRGQIDRNDQGFLLESDSGLLVMDGAIEDTP